MRTYRVRAAGLCLVVAALTAVYISACATRQEAAVRPKDVHAVALPPHKPPPPENVEPSPTPSPSPTATQPKNPPAPKSTVVAVPTYNGPPATNPTDAVAHAASVGQARGVRVGVAIKDRQTGVVYGAGDYDGTFASASLVKAFIATSLLVSGKANDANTRSMMYEMIVASNDDDASALYGPAGGSGLAAFIMSRYGISGLAPPPANLAGYWGEFKITPHAMVEFYDAMSRDSVVAPWLMAAMANARATAADGFKQYFGIPSAATSWRIKQGWMCCLDSKTRMHSTGFVDHDRFTVALSIEGSTAVYGNSGIATLNGMAKALMPNGSIPLAAPPPPPTTPPAASPSPSPSPAVPAQAPGTQDGLLSEDN
jgi:hypothetical protein